MPHFNAPSVTIQSRALPRRLSRHALLHCSVAASLSDAAIDRLLRVRAVSARFIRQHLSALFGIATRRSALSLVGAANAFAAALAHKIGLFGGPHRKPHLPRVVPDFERRV